MRAIEQIELPSGLGNAAMWPLATQHINAWLYSHGLSKRDALVLLPFAALLSPMRLALVAQGGTDGEAARSASAWLPGVHTVQTLAQSLPPPMAGADAPLALGSGQPEPSLGALTGHVLLDRLQVAQWLSGAGASPEAQAGFSALPGGDPDWAEALGESDGLAPIAAAKSWMEHGLARLVDTAQALRQASYERLPAEREGFWSDVRSQLGIAAQARPWADLRGALARLSSRAGDEAASAGALERALLQAAVHLAQVDTGPGPLDAVFELQPSAWVVVQIGGPDPHCEALLRHAQAQGVPALRLLADTLPVPLAQAKPVSTGVAAQVQRWFCADPEGLAQATASVVIQALNAGQGPVGLVALDREVIRRVLSLLARAQVPVLDETGWRLSTTPAAAQLMALLQAASTPHDADAVLEWLKRWPSAPVATVQTLELQLRGGQIAWPLANAALAAQPHPAADESVSGQALLRKAATLLHGLRAGPLSVSSADFQSPVHSQPSLLKWLQHLQLQLQADGSWHALTEHEAGQAVLDAVFGPLQCANDQDHWQQDEQALSWAQALSHSSADWQDLVRWVHNSLEQGSYLPRPLVEEREAAPVVLTPLARAMGRSFGLVVVPGADHLHLGPAQSDAWLIKPADAKALNVDGAWRRRQQQRYALAQLLRTPRLCFVRALHNGKEPLAQGPDLVWLGLQVAAPGSLRGGAWPEQPWQPQTEPVPIHAVAQPGPSAGGLLPSQLSASGLQALRDCPYQFFARYVVRLGEAQELGREIQKRDYGNWLHQVLHRFHVERAAQAPHQPVAKGSAQQQAPDPGELEQLRACAEQAAQALGLGRDELLPFAASFEDLAPRYLAWLHEREAQGWHWAAGEEDLVASLLTQPPLALRGRMDRLDAMHPLHAGDAAPPAPDASPHPASLQAHAWSVLDYKTTSANTLKKDLKQPLERIQLVFYAALLARAQPSAARASIAVQDLSAAFVTLDEPQAPQTIEQGDVQAHAQTLCNALANEWTLMAHGAPLKALGSRSACERCAARGLCRKDHWQ